MSAALSTTFVAPPPTEFTNYTLAVCRVVKRHDHLLAIELRQECAVEVSDADRVLAGKPEAVAVEQRHNTRSATEIRRVVDDLSTRCRERA